RSEIAAGKINAAEGKLSIDGHNRAHHKQYEQKHSFHIFSPLLGRSLCLAVLGSQLIESSELLIKLWGRSSEGRIVLVPNHAVKMKHFACPPEVALDQHEARP